MKWAAQYGLIDIMGYLIKAGADVNENVMVRVIMIRFYMQTFYSDCDYYRGMVKCVGLDCPNVSSLAWNS